tara:strand:+ start:4084 stop:4296 length:213 start_codon:yes stop_codon:yes gene_type:complete
MNIVFVNGEIHQHLPANAKVVRVNGEINLRLGRTPVTGYGNNVLGVASADIGKILGVATADIDKVLGVDD